MMTGRVRGLARSALLADLSRLRKLHFAADAATAIRLRRNAALRQACSFEKRAASRALAPLLVASLAP